jgi:hypothetical protein
MKFAMLAIHVAMIVAMPAAPAVTVPATVFRAMIPLLVAMKIAMLTPAWVGRVQVPMLSPRIAVEGAVAAAGLAVAVVWPHDVDMCVRLLRPLLDLLRPLDTAGFRPFGPLGALGAPCCTAHFGTVGLGGVAT